MSELDAMIHIERVEVGIVQDAVRLCMGPAFFMDSVPHVAGLHLLVQDLSAEIAYAKAFLEEHGLSEEDPFLRSFNIDDFNVEVRLFCDRSSLGAEFQHVIADRLAWYLSSTLQRRVLVRLKNGSVPFRLYSGGQVLKDFTDCYRDYMKKMTWVPGTP